MNIKNINGLESLKGEFEAEGLTREQVSIEKIISSANSLDYLVKVGGCEAKSDIDFLQSIQVKSVVAPMIESRFAMRKYMGLIEHSSFENVGVTIETITAVKNISAILDEGHRLTEVTVGRSDLSASAGEANVNSDKVINMTKDVGKEAKKRGLSFTMGGSINQATIDRLKSDHELFDLIDFVETRKCVLDKRLFLESDLLKTAFEVERYLLSLKNDVAKRIVSESESRIKQLSKRS